MQQEEERYKEYWNWLIDAFENDMYKNTDKNFNKRSSITEKGGRPYLYSPREIGEQMVIYFRNCANYGYPLLITGLCLQLGISRQGMLNMKRSSNKELVDIIKKGRLMVETYYEMQLTSALNPAFAIFVLKNIGWRD